MGTVAEWREVLISGGLWGTLMLLFDLFKRRSGNKIPAPYLILLWAVGGFCFGFLVVFGVRVVRWPLVTITLPALAVFVLISSVYRKKTQQLLNNNSSASS